MNYAQKTFFDGDIYVRSKFSCMRSSYDLCAELRGNVGHLPRRISVESVFSLEPGWPGVVSGTGIS